MKRTITTGIDIGTYLTRVVIAEHVKGEPLPRILGTGSAESRGLRHGYIVNKQEAMRSIEAAIAAAEKVAGVKVESVFLAIGGISLESDISHGIAMISRADSEVTELDIEKVLQSSEENLPNRANKEVIHRIPLRYKLDGKDVLGYPEGMKGIKLEVKSLFITSLSQHLKDIIHVVEETGVEVNDIVASPIAASLVALNKKQRTVGCVLANIGAETVSIAVFEDDIPISLQVFPIGSTDITNDIALGLKIPLEEAEQVKTGEGSNRYSKRKLEEIIEARLSDIFELIEAHLKKIGRNGLLPAGIILTGGGAGISTIEDLAKGALKLPSKVISNSMYNHTKQVKDSSWFVAYGLCIYGFDQAKDAKSTHAMSEAKAKFVTWIKQFLP